MARKRTREEIAASKAAAAKAKAAAAAITRREVIEIANPPPDDLDLDPSTAWYLVYTRPRYEEKAEKELRAAGCKTFWPSKHVTIKAPRRAPIEHNVGTFPRYLFVSGVPFRQRQKDRMISETEVATVNGRAVVDIRDIEGVVDVIGTPTGWLRVPNAAIALISNYQTRAKAEKPVPRHGFKAGDAARVISGPFMSFQATVVEAIGLHDAKVLIDMFGGLVPVTMGVAQLDAA